MRAGPVPGDYAGSGDDGVRLPWYAWQEQSGAPLQSNQPYHAYTARGSYTLRVKSAPVATKLTEAGGYAPAGASVGVVTVKNVRTGQAGQTASLGTGLVKGTLTPPVDVAAGDTYEISNSGSVSKAEGDVFLQKMGLIGPGKTPYETVGNEYDRAELFALPHPWFVQLSMPPAPDPTPDPTPDQTPAPTPDSTPDPTLDPAPDPTPDPGSPSEPADVVPASSDIARASARARRARSPARGRRTPWTDRPRPAGRPSRPTASGGASLGALTGISAFRSTGRAPTAPRSASRHPSTAAAGPPPPR